MSKKLRNDSVRGFKTQTVKLERAARKNARLLTKLLRLEEQARGRWARGYRAFVRASNQLADLKRHNTQKESRLKKVIKSWPDDTIRLTKERDKYRAEIEGTKNGLAILGAKLATLREREINEVKNLDEIVHQVFDLNQTVVRASGDRESYLNRHVFVRLVDEKGNLRRQISFTSADGLRRVVAMVNTLTVVRGDLASEAKRLIEKFFERFQKPAEVDKRVKALYELTRQLLVEKTDFKVGPDLYRFLAMELHADIFPELSEAQTLLRQSIRSEKTNSYIRIWQRESLTSKWIAVPQS